MTECHIGDSRSRGRKAAPHKPGNRQVAPFAGNLTAPAA